MIERRERRSIVMNKKFLNAVGIVGFGLLSIFLVDALRLIASPVVSQADARRLKTGRFAYRERQNGKDVGASEIVVERLPDSNYSFSSKITGAFRQCWESVATSEMTPVSANLSMGQDACVTPRFELEYGSGRVTGFSVARSGDSAPVRRSVEDAVPPSAIDQRVDWAYVMTIDLRAGQTFRFDVYDPSTGVSKVAAKVSPPERVEVPAGSFDAFRITYEVAKSRGAETYVVFANAQGPRMMLREDFQNGVVVELVSVKESGS
jgi:hypothetical protein